MALAQRPCPFTELEASEDLTGLQAQNKGGQGVVDIQSKRKFGE